MSAIQSGIDAYNQVYLDQNGDEDELYSEAPATDEEIARLETLAGFPLPAELADFYREFGSLKNRLQDDSHCFWIPSASELVARVQDPDWNPARSLGLIEMIRAYWGNDRSEFDEGRHFDAAQIGALNDGYQCFGWYLGEDIYEGAHFLFFDRNGQIGSLYYHQDLFDEAKRNLKELLSDGLRGELPFDELLAEALDEVRQSLEEFG